MSKVIVFNGSPKKKGTTSKLLAEVIAGAVASGAEVVEYDLNDSGLRGCQGCMTCRRPEAVACIQNDYLKPVYADLVDATGIVLGTPIYMGTITAQSWTLIQRLYPAMAPDFAPRFPGKKFVTVTTQGNPNPDAFKQAVAGVQGFMQRLGWEQVADISWPGAGGDPSDELKQEAFAAGQSVAG